MPLDSLELQLVAALQRFSALQRRADGHGEPAPLLTKTLAELGTALEEVRVAHEQLVDSRTRIEQLQAELRQRSDKYWQLFDAMAEAYLVTKPDSTILEVNRAAAQLFNVSQRFLTGKTLSVFVCEDRTQFLATSARAAAADAPMEMLLKLRPRERAPLTVSAQVTGDAAGLRWVLRPAGSVPRNDVNPSLKTY
jgi:PAS domain S-box-containing protein